MSLAKLSKLLQWTVWLMVVYRKLFRADFRENSHHHRHVVQSIFSRPSSSASNIVHHIASSEKLAFLVIEYSDWKKEYRISKSFSQTTRLSTLACRLSDDNEVFWQKRWKFENWKCELVFCRARQRQKNFSRTRKMVTNPTECILQPTRRDSRSSYHTIESRQTRERGEKSCMLCIWKAEEIRLPSCVAQLSCIRFSKDVRRSFKSSPRKYVWCEIRRKFMYSLWSLNVVCCIA